MIKKLTTFFAMEDKILGRDFLLISLLTIIGATLRIVRLEDLPPGLQGDESWLGLEAQRINQEGSIDIWTSAGWGQPTAVFYWVALFFRFLPPTIFTLRLAVALLGVFTIPLFYLFSVQLFEKRVALISTFLLTFSYWHIHYSRTAYTLISVPLIEVVVLLLVSKFLKEKEYWPLILAGILAGIGVYSYRGYLAFIIFLFFFWLFIFGFRPISLKTLVLGCILFSMLFLFFSLPMLKLLKEKPEDYMGYMRLVAIFDNKEYLEAKEKGQEILFLLRQILRAVSIYFTERNPDFTDGMGLKPLLDPISKLLLIVGVLACLISFRDWRYFLLIAGFLAGIIPVAFTDEFGENRRAITALPMVFLMIGIGANVIYKTFCEKFIKLVENKFYKFLLVAFFVAALLFGPYWNIKTYFTEIVVSEISHFAYAYELKRIAEFLSSFQTEKPYIYFYSPRWSWNYEARLFQAPGFLGEDRSNEFGQFGLEINPNFLPVLYILMPPYHQHIETIKKLYHPNGEFSEVKENDKLLFVAYYLKDLKD